MGLLRIILGLVILGFGSGGWYNIIKSSFSSYESQNKLVTDYDPTVILPILVATIICLIGVWILINGIRSFEMPNKSYSR